MKTANIFHVTDWDMKKFLTLVGIIQLLMIFTLFIDVTGVKIPTFQILVGFIYLAFVPGVLLLRILRIHHLPTTEMILYTVGLSISSIMFLGFFISLIYPLIGITKPFAYFNIISTVTCFVLLLMGLAYYRDRKFSAESVIDPQFIWAPSTLFLLLLPFISVLGTYLVNYYDSNVLLMILILLIAVLTILIGFNKFIPPKMYPFAIFIFAISLLLHRSLVADYLWGTDIQLEYYFSNLVLNNGIWSWSVTHPYNGILSTNMVAPIYSIFCNIDIRWIFKTIYQFFYALVPLALYALFKKQTNSKIAFFACFFFIALSTFYSEMPALARQEIAELFLVIILLLYFNSTINKMKFSFLFILFIFSLITSHYALSYIYMFIFGLTWLLLYIIKEYPSWKKYFSKGSQVSSLKSSPSNRINLSNRINSSKIVSLSQRINLFKKINPKLFKGETQVSFGHVLLFVIFTVAWYMYIASSSSFDQVVRIGGQISRNIFTEFLDPSSSQGLFILTSQSSTLLYSLSKYLLILAQIFILIGLFSIIFSQKKTKFHRDYLYFSLINLVLLISLIIIPLFASSLNTTRLYHISLIFLAPYCIIGGIILLKKVNKYLYKYKGSLPKFNIPFLKFEIHNKVENPFKIMSIFLVVIFLFSSGFTYELVKDHPNSGSLSQKWIKDFGNDKEKIAFFSGYTPEGNVMSAKWLSSHHNTSSFLSIYAGSTDAPHVSSQMNISYNRFQVKDLSNLTADYNNSYIYIGYMGVKYGIISSWESVYIQKTLFINLSQIKSRFNKTDKIYDNGNSVIYSGV
jgi:uncharacterized membrane protein